MNTSFEYQGYKVQISEKKAYLNSPARFHFSISGSPEVACVSKSDAREIASGMIDSIVSSLQ